MNNSTSYYDYIYKVLLLGDSSVGKTCFLLRFADDSFNENHISTIGLDYRLKMITLDNDKIIKMQVWDTAGQDRFRAITKNYYKGAHGIILMYDVSSEQTFINIKTWLATIKENATEKIKIVLVGNKIDDEQTRKVSTEQAKKLSEEYDLTLFETSAKQNIRVIETFNYLTKEIYNSNYVSGETNKKKKDSVIINEKYNANANRIGKKNCCQK
jgi:small GTP-binding protein